VTEGGANARSLSGSDCIDLLSRATNYPLVKPLSVATCMTTGSGTAHAPFPNTQSIKAFNQKRGRKPKMSPPVYMGKSLIYARPELDVDIGMYWSGLSHDFRKFCVDWIELDEI